MGVRHRKLIKWSNAFYYEGADLPAPSTTSRSWNATGESHKELVNITVVIQVLVTVQSKEE